MDRNFDHWFELAGVVVVERVVVEEVEVDLVVQAVAVEVEEIVVVVVADIERNYGSDVANWEYLHLLRFERFDPVVVELIGRLTLDSSIRQSSAVWVVDPKLVSVPIGRYPYQGHRGTEELEILQLSSFADVEEHWDL